MFITHGIDEALYLGHRVAVMATKPGRIVDIIDSPFAGHHGDEDDLRSRPEFGRDRRASEFVDLLTGLWDSWEEGACCTTKSEGSILIQVNSIP